jgi:hypothetical protein
MRVRLFLARAVTALAAVASFILAFPCSLLSQQRGNLHVASFAMTPQSGRGDYGSCGMPSTRRLRKRVVHCNGAEYVDY